MTSVSRIYSEKPVSEQVNDSLNEMAGKMTVSIQKAKAAGVPQGLLVAILAAHFHEETGRLITIRDEE